MFGSNPKKIENRSNKGIELASRIISLMTPERSLTHSPFL
jgi:hypothetical protein